MTKVAKFTGKNSDERNAIISQINTLWMTINPEDHSEAADVRAKVIELLLPAAHCRKQSWNNAVAAAVSAMNESEVSSYISWAIMQYALIYLAYEI